MNTKLLEINEANGDNTYADTLIYTEDESITGRQFDYCIIDATDTLFDTCTFTTCIVKLDRDSKLINCTEIDSLIIAEMHYPDNAEGNARRLFDTLEGNNYRIL